MCACAEFTVYEHVAVCYLTKSKQNCPVSDMPTSFMHIQIQKCVGNFPDTVYCEH